MSAFNETVKSEEYINFLKGDIVYIDLERLYNNSDDTVKEELINILDNQNNHDKWKKAEKVFRLQEASGKDTGVKIKPYLKIWANLGKIDTCLHLIAFNILDSKHGVVTKSLNNIKIKVYDFIDELVITNIDNKTDIKIDNPDIEILCLSNLYKPRKVVNSAVERKFTLMIKGLNEEGISDKLYNEILQTIKETATFNAIEILSYLVVSPQTLRGESTNTVVTYINMLLLRVIVKNIERNKTKHKSFRYELGQSFISSASKDTSSVSEDTSSSLIKLITFKANIDDVISKELSKLNYTMGTKVKRLVYTGDNIEQIPLDKEEYSDKLRERLLSISTESTNYIKVGYICIDVTNSSEYKSRNNEILPFECNEGKIKYNRKDILLVDIPNDVVLIYNIDTLLKELDIKRVGKIRIYLPVSYIGSIYVKTSSDTNISVITDSIFMLTMSVFNNLMKHIEIKHVKRVEYLLDITDDEVVSNYNILTDISKREIIRLIGNRK